MRICHLCQAEVADNEFCAHCTENITRWPEPDLMTPDERVAEFERLMGPLEVPFDLLQKRISYLVGRPIWTHELASSESLDKLKEEMRNRPWYDGNPEQAAESALRNVPDRLRDKFMVFDLDSGEVNKLDKEPLDDLWAGDDEN